MNPNSRKNSYLNLTLGNKVKPKPKSIQISIPCSRLRPGRLPGQGGIPCLCSSGGRG